MEIYETKIKYFPDGTVRYSANYISNFYSSSIYNADIHDHHDNGSDIVHSMKVSYNRSVSTVSDLIHANNWDYFFTLTLDPKKVDRYNYDECCKYIKRFTDIIRHKYSALYILVPEQHKDGAWHFHGLLTNVPDDALYINDNGYYSLQDFKFGFTSIDTIRDSRRAGTYILKYMVKGYNFCTIPKGKKRYWASRNLKKPIVDIDYIDSSMLDSLLMKAYYKKRIDSDFYSGWIFEVIKDE